MSLRVLLPALLAAILSTAAASEEATTPSGRDILRARLAEQEKQAASQPAGPKLSAPTAAAATAGSKGAPADNSPILSGALPTPEASTPAATATKQAPKETPTVLPKMEVKKRRITELDQQLAKQDQAIAREKKNTKPSEVDKLLNDSRIARPLAIFGGESSQFRQQVSSERVNLMEEEKDIMVAIAQATTKEEKDQLQRHLEFLRAERRELEKSLR